MGLGEFGVEIGGCWIECDRNGGASEDDALVFGLGSWVGHSVILWKANMLLEHGARLGSAPRILF